MIALYVTGHGYGHATRASALARALLDLRPGLDLEVRTEAPAWIFQEPCPGLPVSRGEAPLDAALVQRDALDIDLEASRRGQQEAGERWAALIAGEARWLEERGARLVVGDVPPLAFAAAEAAGLPSIGVSNFSWDWIFEPYAAADPRWEPARRRCAQAYGAAETLYRLPLHGDFPAFRRVVDAPLLARVRRADPLAWRRAKGLGRDRRPLVLLAFGGYGVALPALDAEPPPGKSLKELLFAGFGPAPRGLEPSWLELRGGTSGDQLDAMAACDAVLSKPGYGIVSEAFAHGKRLLYVPREGFREMGPLVAGMQDRGACAPLPRADFAAGRWAGALAALLAGPAPDVLPADGGPWLARRLLARLDEL